MKANRAKKLLDKRATSKEEKISAAMAAGHEWESDVSEDDVMVKRVVFLNFNNEKF